LGGVALVGCSTDVFVSDAGTSDATSMDGPTTDSGMPDGGPSDGGKADGTPPPEAGCDFLGPAPSCGPMCSGEACCVGTTVACSATVCTNAAMFRCVRPDDCKDGGGPIPCCLSFPAAMSQCPTVFPTASVATCSTFNGCLSGEYRVCVNSNDCTGSQTCVMANIMGNTSFTFGICQ